MILQEIDTMSDIKKNGITYINMRTIQNRSEPAGGKLTEIGASGLSWD